MNTIEATYTINTPMFLGSADEKIAEIRPPSINGILRFWFRALALAEFNGDKDEVERLEGIVFGTTRGNNARKAQYSLKVKRNSIKGTGKDIKEERQGISYLGYGPISYDRERRKTIYTRNYIRVNSLLKVILIENLGIRSRIKGTDVELGTNLLIDSLKSLGIFGGLGSRTRKGFGSLTLLDMKKDGEDIINGHYCGTVSELELEINYLLSKSKEYGNEMKDIDYTAFSKFTQIVATKQYRDPLELLNDIGKEMIRYRSYGRNGKVLNNESAERIFKDDHDLVYGYAKSGEMDKHPKRVVFGLPHNYRIKGGSVNINSTNRRASPLFIHIHKLANNNYIGILTLIPAKFLKADDNIKVAHKIKKKKQKSNASFDEKEMEQKSIFSREYRIYTHREFC